MVASECRIAAANIRPAPEGGPTLTSDEFTFEPPAGWTRAADARRLTFIDGRGGVLVVSSSRVTPDDSADVFEAALANAFAAVRAAASDGELEQISELHESPHPNLRCWQGEARARDRSVVFSQCVLASRHGVLLATLETPPPEQTHREMFQSFLRSAASAELRSILQHVRHTPPTCIANAAPRLDAEPEPEPDNEQFGTSFRLGCPCGSRETAVLCHPTKVGSDTVILAPLALRCRACNSVAEIFNPALHGYDATVCRGGAGMRGTGERQLHRCTACGQTAGEAIASFSFNDPEGLQTLPEDLAGCEQDAFDWFALDWQCAACGEVNSVSDYECA